MFLLNVSGALVSPKRVFFESESSAVPLKNRLSAVFLPDWDLPKTLVAGKNSEEFRVAWRFYALVHPIRRMTVLEG